MCRAEVFPVFPAALCSGTGVAPVSRLEQESACRGGASGVAGVDDVFEAVVVGFGDLPVGVFEEEQGEYEDAGDGKCNEYRHSVVHDASFPRGCWLT